jgi:hypothetical protein
VPRVERRVATAGRVGPGRRQAALRANPSGPLPSSTQLPIRAAGPGPKPLGVAAAHRAPRVRGTRACRRRRWRLRRNRARAAHLRGTLGRMNSDMDTDLPASELDRSELLDVLRRTMEAAGMDAGADVHDLPARVAYLRRQAEAQPLRRDPWAEVPEPMSLPRPGPGEIPRPAENPGWPQPPTVT